MTDDDIFWKGSAEDWNAKSQSDEDEGTHCEDGDSNTDW